MQYLLHLKRLIIAFVLYYFSSNILADDESMSILGDIETVSIATGREQPIVTAPAVTTVFKANDIKNSGSRNLDDILNMVPGIHIGSSFMHYDSIYSVRGFSSLFNKHILIMIDGVPQDDLTFGNRKIVLGKIPIDVIDRVEVSRGPGSALWGADAFSAVVNIITKTEKPESSLIAISNGSFDTRNARVLTGATISDFDLLAAFEYSKTDGHEPIITQDQQTLLDVRFGTDASLAPGNAYTGYEELGAVINISDSNSQLSLRTFQRNNVGMGIGFAAALDPYGSVDNEGFGLTYEYNKDMTETFSFGATMAYLQSNYATNNIHFFPPGAFGVFPDGVILNKEHKQKNIKASASLIYSGIAQHHLSLGVGGENGKVEELKESRNYNISNGSIIPIDMQDTLSDPVVGEARMSRELLFVYLQDEWILNRDWSFTLGVRYDDYNSFGSVTSQRAVLVWNTTNVLTTKLLYGRGFRLPMSTETDAKHLPAIEGNRELQPEKLDQIQLVFDYWPLWNCKVRFDLFYHKTDDQIRGVNTGGPSFRPENIGSQTGRGMELELWLDISPRSKLYSYYVYQDNTDEATNSDTGYAPHHKLFTMLTNELSEGWFFNTKATYVGKRDRGAGDDRKDADTYTFFDMLVRKEITKNIETTFEIRNVFDKETEEAGFRTSFPGDMPLPGRNYYLTFLAKF
jgi:iron complex outermembrane receptor protein